MLRGRHPTKLQGEDYLNDGAHEAHLDWLESCLLSGNHNEIVDKRHFTQTSSSRKADFGAAVQARHKYQAYSDRHPLHFCIQSSKLSAWYGQTPSERTGRGPFIGQKSFIGISIPQPVDHFKPLDVVFSVPLAYGHAESGVKLTLIATALCVFVAVEPSKSSTVEFFIQQIPSKKL